MAQSFMMGALVTCFDVSQTGHAEEAFAFGKTSSECFISVLMDITTNCCLLSPTILWSIAPPSSPFLRCLSFDNGLAGALHVTGATADPGRSTPGEVEKSTCCLLYALLDALLAKATAETPPSLLQSSGSSASSNGAEAGRDSAEPAAAVLGSLGSPAGEATSDGGAVGDRLLAGVVIDEDLRFAALFRELGLERVCDADWVRFEPVGSAGPVPAQPAPCLVDSGRDRGLLPLAALVMKP